MATCENYVVLTSLHAYAKRAKLTKCSVQVPYIYRAQTLAQTKKQGNGIYIYIGRRPWRRPPEKATKRHIYIYI